MITTQPYVDLLNLGVLEELGILGEGITIALIGGPVDTPASGLQGADIATVTPCPYTSIPDSISYGTAMASPLVSPNYEIVPGATTINYITPFRGEDLTQEDRRCATGFTRMMILTLNNGADAVSCSVGGNSSGAMAPTLTKTDLDGAVVVAVMGNNNQEDYVESYVSSNPTVGVATIDVYGNRADYSNCGKGTTAALYGGPVSTHDCPSGRICHKTKGTLAATALTSGYLVSATEKWPKIMNRQILQSFVRTAIRGDGVEWDSGYGYGLANPRGLLTEDPINLSDGNPLLHKNDEWVPSEEYYNDYIDGLLDPINHWTQDPNYTYRSSDSGVVRTISHKTAYGTSPRYHRDPYAPPAPPTPSPSRHHHTLQK